MSRRLHVHHGSLMLGPIVSLLVKWSTAAALLLILSGSWLWWPDRIWWVNVKASWKRINFDLHHVLGIYSFVVLLPMILTGVLFSFRPIDRVVARLAAVPPPPTVAPADSGAAIQLDRSLAAARARL